MNQRRLTPRQEQMLVHLQTYHAKNGYSPSLKEIAQDFDLRSTSTVHSHLQALQAQGYVRRFDRRPRSLRITNLGYHYLKLIRPEVENQLELWRRRHRNQQRVFEEIPAELLMAPLHSGGARPTGHRGITPTTFTGSAACRGTGWTGPLARAIIGTNFNF